MRKFIVDWNFESINKVEGDFQEEYEYNIRRVITGKG